MSTFWSVWIIVITAIMYIGLAVLIWTNRASKSRGQDHSIGHEFDGIHECDAPQPHWFAWMFAGLMVFGAGYLLAYPGLGNFPGLLGWTQHNQLEREVAAAEATYGPIFARYGAMSVEELAQTPEALRMGQRLFANNCAQCHGSDARGSFGFPNLTDGRWQWGGSPEQIRHSIEHGRVAVMPGWQAALGDSGVNAVTQYVLALNDRATQPELVEAGKAHFATFCASCHGAEGKGNPLFGAPDLTDDTWLYGGTPGMIQYAIRHGRQGVMPAQRDLISADRLQILTGYVYSLSQQP